MKIALAFFPILLSISLGAAELSAPLACHAVFHSELSDFLTFKNNYRVYFAQRAENSAELEQTVLSLHSDIEKLAFFEAYADSTGRDYLSWLKLADEDSKKSDQFLALIKSFDLDQPTTSYRLMSFLEQAYIVANRPPLGWRRFFGQSYRKIIDQRIELELAQSDLSAALRELGLIRDQTILERMKWWQRSFVNYEQLTLNFGTNWLLYQVLGMPLLIPKTMFTRAKDSGGFTSADVLKRAESRRGKIGAGFDFATDKTRRALFAGIMALATAHAVAHWTEIEKTSELFANRVSSLIEAKDQTLDYTVTPELEASLHTAVYQEWARLQLARHSHQPDPIHSLTDRARWIQFQESLTPE